MAIAKLAIKAKNQIAERRSAEVIGNVFIHDELWSEAVSLKEWWDVVLPFLKKTVSDVSLPDYRWYKDGLMPWYHEGEEIIPV